MAIRRRGHPGRNHRSAQSYIEYLNQHGWAVANSGSSPPFFQTSYGTQLLSILGRHLPPPQALLDATEITANNYYINISYYLGAYRTQNPQYFVDVDLDFDPVELTAGARAARRGADLGRGQTVQGRTPT